MSDLQGKRAYVTGAAQGIGLAIARRLVEGGARVCLTDVNEEQVRAAAAELGEEHMGARCDVRSAEEVEKTMQAAADAFGGLDIVVNNAGIEIGKPFTETSTEEFRNILDINVIGVFHGMKSAVPHLAQTKGVIINLASVAGLGGCPLLSAYCASKGAVMRLSEVGAIELRDAGVRVIPICPAFVDTEMVDRLIPAVEELTGANFGDLAAMKQTRMGTVEDVAEGVAFVASDEMSWMTGQPLVLDGGLTGSLL